MTLWSGGSRRGMGTFKGLHLGRIREDSAPNKNIPEQREDWRNPFQV